MLGVIQLSNYSFVLFSAHHVTHRANSMRLAVYTVHFATLLLFCYYSAVFTADCTFREPKLPFKNFEGLLKDGSYPLGMMQASAEMNYFKVSRFNILFGLNFK